MISAKKVIAVNKEIMLQVSHQSEFKTVIKEVEERIFWIGLPRLEGQVLMLQENQQLRIRIPMRYGFYSAETKLAATGESYNKFYGLTIPENFTKTQERQFMRAFYATNVACSSDHIAAQTVLVNFSAGGVKVYLTPDLEKILQSNSDITISFQIDDYSFRLNAHLSWRNSYDNVLYAGFEFSYILPVFQKKLEMLAIKYATKSK